MCLAFDLSPDIVKLLFSWSDGDKCWDLVSSDTKREMGLHYLHDGEFWIEFFEDFCKEFEVCYHFRTVFN